MTNNRILVSVIGGHKCTRDVETLAESVGGIVARAGCVLVSGGLGGVMEAASRGAKESGGLTIGIIPGRDKKDANKFVDIAIATGLGYARNALVALCADLVIALPGEYGTLSEIGFALNAKKKVYGINAWDIPGVINLPSLKELEYELTKYVKEINPGI